MRNQKQRPDSKTGLRGPTRTSDSMSLVGWTISRQQFVMVMFPPSSCVYAKTAAQSQYTAYRANPLEKLALPNTNDRHGW